MRTARRAQKAPTRTRPSRARSCSSNAVIRKLLKMKNRSTPKALRPRDRTGPRRQLRSRPVQEVVNEDAEEGHEAQPIELGEIEPITHDRTRVEGALRLAPHEFSRESSAGHSLGKSRASVSSVYGFAYTPGMAPDGNALSGKQFQLSSWWAQRTPRRQRRLRADGPLVSPSGDLDGEAPVAERGDD
jgi:hypothetical protein